MKTLTQLAMLIYPADWRRRYGREFTCLLEDSGRQSGWRDVFDIVRGGLTMRFTGKHIATTAIAWGVVGALVGYGLSTRMPARYQATSVMQGRIGLSNYRMEHSRPPSEEYFRTSTKPAPADIFAGLSTRALGATRLERIVNTYHLYSNGAYTAGLSAHTFGPFPLQREWSIQEKAERLRQEIRIAVASDGTVSVSFVGNNPQITAEVTNQVTALVAATVTDLRKDPAAAWDTMYELSPARIPEVPVDPYHWRFLISGLVSGLLLGTMIALLRQPPTGLAA